MIVILFSRALGQNGEAGAHSSRGFLATSHASLPILWPSRRQCITIGNETTRSGAHHRVE